MCFSVLIIETFELRGGLILKTLRKLGAYNRSTGFIDPEGVQYWRERIYSYMISAMLVLGLVVVVPSAWLSFSVGYTGLGFFDIFAYLAIVAIFFLRRLPYVIRAGSLMIISLAVGVVVFLITGDEGAGFFWIFVVPPLASLLLGLKWGTLFLLLNAGIVVAIGFLVATNSPTMPRILEFTLAGWIVYGLNFLITNAIVTLPLGALLNGLLHSTEDARKSKVFVENVIQTANVIFLQLDTSGTIIKINKAAEEITGYTARELEGGNWNEMVVQHGRFDLAWQKFDRQVVQEERPESFESPILTKTDVERQILWKNNILYEEDKVVGTIFFGVDITERKLATEKIRRQVEHLKALTEIDRTILSNLDLHQNLESIVRITARQLEADAVHVLLWEGRSEKLKSAAAQGFHTTALQATHLGLGQGYAGKAALERQMVSVPTLADRTDSPDLKRAIEGEGFISYFGVPLIAKDQVVGVMEIYQRRLLVPAQDWLDLLNTLAGQMAIAVDSSSLFRDLQLANDNLVLAYDAAIEGWSRALDLRDEETEGHTLRVTELTLKLARQMGISDQEVVHMRRGALLHDIGKMGIPDSILLKPGELTEEEWKKMKMHPIHAREMLGSIHYLQEAMDIPYSHHEKWDGTGYPQGLKGEQIPLPARIFSVIDVYDALTSDRPYRKAWPKEKAVAYIKEQSGVYFEPGIVTAFLKLQLP